MARGKYLSLDEARRLGRIDQFCNEHPSRGSWQQFDAMMDWFAGPKAKSSSRAVRTSSKAGGACSSDTQTRRDTSEDA